jgi:hypothetical protein
MLASPNMGVQLKLMLMKASLVLVAGQFTAIPEWQAGLCLGLAVMCMWLVLNQVRGLWLK